MGQSNDLSLLQASCPDVKLPGASEIKPSARSKSCTETFGEGWATASTAQVYEWCGCEMGTYCKCSKIAPMITGTWDIWSLTDGQALGPGYKSEVKPTAPGQAEKGGTD